jgi:hypothetical protein
MGLMEITVLVEREEIAPQVGREHRYVIDIWAVIFQFGKWSRLGGHFPVRKVVQDFLWTIIFEFGKWSRTDSHFHKENGPTDC